METAAGRNLNWSAGLQTLSTRVKQQPHASDEHRTFSSANNATDAPPASGGRGFQPREIPPAPPPGFPHAADLRKHRFDAAEHIYFVTKRRAVGVEVDLSKPPPADEIVGALFWLLEQQRIWLPGFVLMPDHLHPVLAPRATFSLKQVLHSLFSFSAQRINQRFQRHGALWMEEYFEHHLRDRDEVRPCLNYLHLNPVRRGFVQQATDWSYSSAQASYHERLSWAWFLGG
jgi:REP element-mobilizing transposase RayT